MAFAPGSGINGYIGTPRPAKRPYTRSYVHSPGIGTQPAPSVRQGTTTIHTPQVPQQSQPTQPQTPAVPTPQAAPAQQAAQGVAPGVMAQGLINYLSSIQDPNERAFVQSRLM